MDESKKYLFYLARIGREKKMSDNEFDMWGERTTYGERRILHKKIDLDIGEEKVYGYHSKEIMKGVVGEISKIREELDEVVDAESTGNKVMLLVELSDLILAIERYLEKHHPNITVKDLLVMAAATKRAFDNGTRT